MLDDVQHFPCFYPYVIIKERTRACTEGVIGLDSEKKDRDKEEVYKRAIIEYAKETIQNPDFFKLTPEEQKNRAMEVLRKHKNEGGI